MRQAGGFNPSPRPRNRASANAYALAEAAPAGGDGEAATARAEHPVTYRPKELAGFARERSREAGPLIA